MTPHASSDDWLVWYGGPKAMHWPTHVNVRVRVRVRFD